MSKNTIKATRRGILAPLLLCVAISQVAYAQFTGSASQLVYYKTATSLYYRKDLATGTEYSNAKAAVVINDAINAVTAAGGTVHLMGGTTYHLDNDANGLEWIKMKSNVTLQGEGPSTVISLTGSNWPGGTIDVRGQSNWVIRDMKFTEPDWDSKPVSTTRINAIAATKCQQANVDSFGGCLQAEVGQYAEKGRIMNVSGENLSGELVQITQGARDIVCRNLRVKNTIRSGVRLVYDTPSADKSIENIMGENIIVSGTLDHGITVSAAYGKNFILRGAIVEGAENGSAVVAGLNVSGAASKTMLVKDVIVRSNFVGVYANTANGVSLSNIGAYRNRAQGIYTRNLVRASLENVTAVDNSTDTANLYDGIYMYSTGVGNHNHLLSNVRAKNVELANQQKYGVNFEGSDHSLFNHDTNGATGAYYAPSAQNIKVDTVVQ